MTENKIVLVKRKTRLEDMITRFNTIAQAKFYIEHLGADFSDYLKEDQAYKEAIVAANNILSSLGRVQIIDRMFLANFIFGANDLVVVIGQDGLVANTLKYLSSQRLIGVNPDPQRWDGILLPFEVKDLSTIVPETFNHHRPIQQVTMGKVVLNDGQVLYAVNDFFIGQKSHVSARYEIEIGKKREQQSSSGVIVSTGLGSTGWLKSVLLGASTIMSTFTEKKITRKPEAKLKWDADCLYFSVREPFPSKATKTDIVFGKLSKTEPLKITSLMPESGVIFSDGIENDYLSFNSGITATVTIAEQKGELVF
jgi:NAD kinase